ncbi:tRNA pseudouridine(38-40) synthase TruA [Halorarum salinum]|uniref:tRNA pseudouridine synthase A n=1 Tax=Halorarum salinum TaxID=2743089 RepID=A0A7D5L9R5_9EURY|nr:tRNA pseudouridine(38-40) synthase TruA [Halobaculum salinum]QLG61291.1 tRNA pseudouridine(38-40) synthase TruA [Halobaculum salinum]
MRAFRVAYDGRPFYGFQRQPDVPTVEGTLFDGLRALDVLGPDEPKPPGYAAAGRTDAGVSAVAQTLAFDAPDWLAPRAFNAELPGTVRVRASAEAPDGFHATHDAVRRVYRYHLHAPASGTDASPGTDAMLGRARDAAARLSGEHDFHNLTTDDEGTVRDLECTVDRDGEFLVVTAAAGGFPRHFVRKLVAVIHGVATGEATGADGTDRLDRVLSDESLADEAGVPAAPPEPLVLVGVDYPGLTFEPDPVATATLREVFADRRRDGLVRARVADEVLDGV